MVLSGCCHSRPQGESRSRSPFRSAPCGWVTMALFLHLSATRLHLQSEETNVYTVGLLSRLVNNVYLVHRTVPGTQHVLSKW